MKNLKRLQADVIELLCSSKVHVRAIYIFGSYADGTASAKSDIDIGLRCDAEIPLQTIGELSALLETKLNLEVDLLDMMTVSTVMQMQVVSKGIRIYCEDHFEAESNDDLVYLSYTRLNEERAGILKDIKARGNVYGNVQVNKSKITEKLNQLYSAEDSSLDCCLQSMQRSSLDQEEW